MQLRFAAAAQRGKGGHELAFILSSGLMVALTLRRAATARYSSRIIPNPTRFRQGRAVITLSVAKRHVVSAHAHSWILHPAFATIIAVHLQRAR